MNKGNLVLITDLATRKAFSLPIVQKKQISHNTYVFKLKLASP